ncbi:MAG: hypothetical protein CBC55_02360 [Gammaproteobacteria bacterium TMED95]|nr:MAG: hypothetical protein CBC55_02360 [Gammaproteobacteria bacterium TMED95]|tara:strand:+ start:12687 stop:13280 length:594 start_codon:yes stop_codon:yes gene_type:complete
MTLSASLNDKIAALSAFSESVAAASSIITANEQASESEHLKRVGALIREHIDNTTSHNIADDSEVGATLVKCVDEMLAGKPGSFFVDEKHLKNDGGGNDHYVVTYTLTPPTMEAVTVDVPIVIDREETEAELSTYSPLRVNGEETTISADTLDVFISTASSFLLECAWLPQFVGEDTLKKAHETLVNAEPILSQIPH